MLYFDTSFLAPLFRKETSSGSIEQFFRRQSVEDLAISHWTRAEFSNILARDMRMGVIEPQAAIDLDAQFETNVVRSFALILPDINDFDLCRRYLQRYETALRLGDALHLAIANNHGAERFLTLDKKLLKAGKLLGLPVTTGVRD
jgi:predicted nucleic acid-binding protein